jgi:hypothetical protein
VGGEREPKIGLRKGGDDATEGGGHGIRNFRFSFYRNKDAFVVIDIETRGSREVTKKGLEVTDVSQNGANDDKGVIRILENRERKIINKGVEKKPRARGMKQKLLKHIDDDVEEEGERGSPCRSPLRH